jgi:alpha-ketoglutarate-dependent taurine dioxygenase
MSTAHLDDLLAQARHHLQQHGWAVVPGAPFLRNRAADPAAALALARRFGRPSIRDGGPIWPVSPDPAAAEPTFSQRSGAAEPHTDSQYHAKPEPLVCLFVVRPAATGGDTLLLTAGDAVAAVAALPEGSQALRLLAEPRWSWTPPRVFVCAHPAPPPMPVLSGDGTIRWRADNLCPEISLPQARAANVFASCLRSAPGTVTLPQHPGDMVLIDNRRTPSPIPTGCC